MPKSPVTLVASLLLMPLCLQAEGQTGLSFLYNDWEIACDNTRTCRVAGYQSDGGGLPVSVLLTRQAGAGEPVSGEVMVGTDDNEALLDKLPPEFKLSLFIDGKAIGEVEVGKDDLGGKLSQQQVDALLAVLPRSSLIEWVFGENRWRLSDKGAAAILLKMDEFQGRIGTQGALARKGEQDERAVLPPLLKPVVVAAPVAKALPGDNGWLEDKKKAEALLAELRATVTEDDDCTELLENALADAELSVARLTDSKLLASARCWTAAYNFGYGYWVVNATPPYQPMLVTESGSDYSDGSITELHKGRGLGDCWSSETWTWDGKQFVHTETSSSGMCKMVAAGGAWKLPTLVTEVRQPTQ